MVKVYVKNLGGTSQIKDVAEVGDTMTSMLIIQIAPAANDQDYLQLKPTDFGANKPYYFVKSTSAEHWTMGLWDGADTGGTLEHAVANLTHNGSAIWNASTLPYATASWTPGISFGGGITGIAYTTQVGRYTKIGNLVWIQGLIVLSSKGSSTGNARITGLPVASSSVANNFSGMGLLHNSMSSAGPFYNYAGASSSVLEVLKASVNTTIVADQTDFSNTTALTIGFMYMTD